MANNKCSYVILKATKDIPNIVDSLIQIENKCWEGLELSREKILLRLETNMCLISMVDHIIVGVLYCQLVESYEPILCNITTFATQESLHDPNGNILQLLGVAVLPQYSNLQIGRGLRDFVLETSIKAGNITSVIAMTRCSTPSQSIEDYFNKVHSLIDPTLVFHCVIGGATVVTIVKDYRPEDILNHGCSILIQYDIKIMYNDFNTDDIHINRQQQHPVLHDNPQVTITVSDILELVQNNLSMKVSSDCLKHENIFETLAAELHQLEHKSFMHFGLDSLAMMDLRNELTKKLNRRDMNNFSIGNNAQDSRNTRTGIVLSPTILFDFPTPALLVKEINRSLISEEKLSTAISSSRHIESNTSFGNMFEENIGSKIIDIDSFAIIGMSCRFPGGANDPDTFHHLLCNGFNSIREIPEDWHWNTSSKYAAFLDDTEAETFDPSLYNLTTAEVKRMDPHQRLILKISYEALTEAGVLNNNYEDSNGDMKQIGVFVGLCNNEWISPDLNSKTEVSQQAAANRLSFLLGLTGPSLVIDTACSSSLAALHTAMNSIKCGDCDLAIVAAADLLLSENSIKIREAANMLSSDGKNKTFDDLADGYVRGEGAGAIVIQRLSDAEANPNRSILAVIKGSAMNQDGRSASFTAPNGSAQRQLLRNALKRANVVPSDICYIEAHGTGTSLGDPIEWGAIRDVLLADDTCEKHSNPLVVGAAKSNIGHLEGAAGMAGLIKVVNCLRSRSVPGNLHLNALNKNMLFDPKHRAAIFPKGTIQLPEDDVLYAGVSSLDSTGTNVHIILQSYQDNRAVNKPKQVPVPDQDNIPSVLAHPISFVFSGQGLVYTKMGSGLFEAEPIFRESIIRCSNAVLINPSLLEVMYPNANMPPEYASLIYDSTYSQLAIVALEVSLASLWKTRGVNPNVVTGHSLGEYAAAVTAGILTIECAMQMVYIRSKCLAEFYKEYEMVVGRSKGVMVAVRKSEKDGLEAINQLNTNQVFIASVQGPSSIVLSGEESSIIEVLNLLGNPSSKFLNVDYPYHSNLIKGAADKYKIHLDNLISDVRANFPIKNKYSIPFISCQTGKLIDPELVLSSQYWTDQMLNTVRFMNCIQTLYSEFDVKLMIEIGPSTTLIDLIPVCLSSFITSTDQKSLLMTLSSLDKTKNDADYFNSSASLANRRCNLNQFQNSIPIVFKWRQRKTKSSVENELSPMIADSFSIGYIHEILYEAIVSVLSKDAIACLDNDRENTSLIALGIDSLASLSIRNYIMSKLHIKEQLSNVLVLKYPTIARLSEYLLDVGGHHIQTLQ